MLLDRAKVLASKLHVEALCCQLPAASSLECQLL